MNAWRWACLTALCFWAGVEAANLVVTRFLRRQARRRQADHARLFGALSDAPIWGSMMADPHYAPAREAMDRAPHPSLTDERLAEVVAEWSAS